MEGFLQSTHPYSGQRGLEAWGWLKLGTIGQLCDILPNVKDPDENAVVESG